MTAAPRYPAHIRQLKANLTGTREAFRRHRKNCYRCTLAHRAGQLHLSCDTGWEWHKDEWRFMRELTRINHPELLVDGDQLALF